jgi:hypothetical protein
MALRREESLAVATGAAEGPAGIELTVEGAGLGEVVDAVLDTTGGDVIDEGRETAETIVSTRSLSHHITVKADHSRQEYLFYHNCPSLRSAHLPPSWRVAFFFWQRDRLLVRGVPPRALLGQYRQGESNVR